MADFSIQPAAGALGRAEAPETQAPARGSAAWGAAPADLQIVTFEIAGQCYGLPIDLVREVVPLPALLELAGAPPVLCGLLNRRGSYVPVINGRLAVGKPHFASIDCQVVLAGADHADLGLLVDRVLAVRVIRADQRTALDRQVVAPFLESVVVDQDGPILLLHFPALLAMARALDSGALS